MMVVAYLLVLFLIKYTRFYEGFTYEEGVDVTIFAIAGGVIGARLFYVGLNLGTFLKQPEHIMYIREGGLSWHGGLIGGFLGMVALHLWKKMPLGKIADFASVHATIALAVGRIGCFLNGCCYGKECNVPWAVEFKGAGIHGLRHPTQIYESLMLIVCFIGMLWWWKKKKFNGEMTLLMFSSYGLVRFIVEIFRENTPDQYPGGLPFSLAQYFSVFLMVACAAAIIIKRLRIKEPLKSDSQGVEKDKENGAVSSLPSTSPDPRA